VKTTYLHSKKIIAIPTINLACDCFARTVSWLANDGQPARTEEQKLLITDITTDYQTNRKPRDEELSLDHQAKLGLTEITPVDYYQVQNSELFFTNPYPVFIAIRTQIRESPYNYFVLNLVYGKKTHGIGIIKRGTEFQVFDKAKSGPFKLEERILELAFSTPLTLFQVIPYQRTPQVLRPLPAGVTKASPLLKRRRLEK
jgi:hypothetical protein